MAKYKKVLLSIGLVVFLIMMVNIVIFHKEEYEDITEEYAVEDYKMGIYIDNEEVILKDRPIVFLDKVYLPLDEFFSEIGATVEDYDLNDKNVTVNINNHDIQLKIVYKVFSLEEKLLSKDLLVYKNKLMVPLRLIAEEGQYRVHYDQETKKITIQTS